MFQRKSLEFILLFNRAYNFVDLFQGFQALPIWDHVGSTVVIAKDPPRGLHITQHPTSYVMSGSMGLGTSEDCN